MTSIASVDKLYVEVCKNAANDSSVFDTFKQNKHYTAILEHTPQQLVEHYISKCSTDLIKSNWLKFSLNDQLGNPAKVVCSVGCFSPSTIRYIKINTPANIIVKNIFASCKRQKNVRLIINKINLEIFKPFK